MAKLMKIVLWIAALLDSGFVVAAPTWPATTDELEDIMYLATGYRARNFAAPVTPCSSSSGGPGRNTAAEWVRTAFHDMATANTYFGTGGLDASIVYELTNGENTGQGFAAAVTTWAPFFGPKVSMSDIIALGLSTAVRSCGGPAVPVRGGRIDAIKAGDTGVPQPQNAVSIFQNQFLRMGFNTAEMIGLVACGHTLGGVHAANFPQIVAAGTVANDYAPMDTTISTFDERIASEYVSGTTTNPLVVGISRQSKRDSDNRVYSADGNVTIRAMSDPATFKSRCQNLFQRMIEVVPKGVTLNADTVTPYEVKPYALKLYLMDGGDQMTFSGEIRVRTTSRLVSNVQLSYKDRSGGNGGIIDATSIGTANGLDDSFTFYRFSTTISSSSSISSFNVVVDSQTFDNNGAGFPMQDSVLLQFPQSCMASDEISVLAAVRNTASGTPTLLTTVRTPRNNVPVPFLNTTSTPMSTTSTPLFGPYTLYNARVSFSSSQAGTAKFGISLGSGSNGYTIDLQDVSGLANSCSSLGGNSTSTSTTSSGIVSSSTIQQSSSSVSVSSTIQQSSSSEITSSTTQQSLSSTAAESTTSTILTSFSSIVSTTTTTTLSLTTSTSTPTSTLAYKGCYRDSVSSRTFSGPSLYSSSMTYSSCADFCKPYPFFGLEYGRECYCSAWVPSDNLQVEETDCSMTCSGDMNELCGNGDRLSVFAQFADAKSPVNKAIVSASGTNHTFTYQACWTDDPSSRTLNSIRVNDDNLTLEKCATTCAQGGYRMMGVEYHSECYCGNEVATTATKSGNEQDCGMLCSGDPQEICGGSAWTYSVDT